MSSTKNLTKGVYYIPKQDKIVELSKVEIYKDLRRTFAICSWRDNNGKFNRVAVRGYQFKFFKRIGSL